MAKVKQRTLKFSVVPGQPKELVEAGKAKLCIHLFVPDSRGPFAEPHVLQLDKVAADDGRPNMKYGKMQGRLACDQNRIRRVVPVTKGDKTIITMRTDDPRAVTCPNCIGSADYQSLMNFISGQQTPAPDTETKE